MNNRRSNLRRATNSINQHNAAAKRTSQTGVRGVAWDAEKGKYRARCYLNGKSHSLGYFEDLESAAEVVAEWKAKVLDSWG